jgi:3-dehydroquinate synthetase
LPTRLKNISHSAIIKAYLHDKKFIAGINRFVLVKRIGSVLVKQNVPLYLIKKALSEISQ